MHQPFNPRITLGLAALLALVLLGLTPTAGAQEVLYTPSATSPGKGIWATRHNFSFESFDGNNAGAPYSLDQTTVETAFAYGITADLTVMGHLPLRYRAYDGAGGVGTGDEYGVDDMRTMLKYRFFQKDVGNIDTVRMSAMAGIEIPSYDTEFSSDSWDLFVGIALTAIEGRHGVGAHAMFQLNTGTDDTGVGFSDSKHDAVRLDGSYLYRIDPVEYTIDSTRSTYIMVELNNRYDVSGDYETLISPGILIEAQTWAAEVALRLPIVQEVENRAELDWAVTVGLRFTY